MPDDYKNLYFSLKPAPTPVGSKLTASNDPGLYKLDTAAGSVLTLPAATGSGKVVKVLVSTTATSNAHKILTAPITDLLIGQAVGQTGNATKQFSAAVASGFHSIQMPFAGTQPSGGFEGDIYEFTDIAAGVWMVDGKYQAGVTPTTPFSTATT
jgi:hypothetical protein